MNPYEAPRSELERRDGTGPSASALALAGIASAARLFGAHIVGMLGFAALAAAPRAAATILMAPTGSTDQSEMIKMMLVTTGVWLLVQLLVTPLQAGAIVAWASGEDDPMTFARSRYGRALLLNAAWTIPIQLGMLVLLPGIGLLIVAVLLVDPFEYLRGGSAHQGTSWTRVGPRLVGLLPLVLVGLAWAQVEIFPQLWALDHGGVAVLAVTLLGRLFALYGWAVFIEINRLSAE